MYSTHWVLCCYFSNRFRYRSFHKSPNVVVEEKSRTNLTVRFLIWPIFFFVTFVVVWLFLGIFGVGTGILFVDISPGFGLGVLAAWFVGNLYHQTTKVIE